MIAATQQPPAINIKALSWTIGIHAVLLLLFFLWRYTIPAITAEIGNGLEVNLGSSETGSGNDQPMSKEDPSSFSAAVIYKDAEVKTQLPKDMMHSDATDAPVVNDPNKKDIKGQTGTKPNTTVPLIPKSVYGGDNNGKGGNGAKDNKPGTNEGITTGPGDQGINGGTPGATNYTGIPGSGGGGTYHTLTGRDITPKKLEAEFREGGKVVISVTVDRDGNIVSKFVKSSSNPELTRIAMDKISKAKFSKSNSSAPQQFGDVTIVFKAR